MLIDTHAHLNFKQFRKDRDKVIKRALGAGVKKIINVGTNLKTSRKSVEIAEKYDNVFASVSLHPIDVEKEEFNEKIWLKLAQHQKVVAIGETGFDFYHQSDRKKQKEIFEKLIGIARKTRKPLIIHSREADNQALKVLEKNKLPFKVGVIHCFGRGFDVAQRFLKLGFLISYTGNITYNKKRAASIKKVPLDKIMVETDCPFMTPEPFRDKRNEPLYLKYIAQKIAETKEISFDEVAEVTTKNAEDLFKL